MKRGYFVELGFPMFVDFMLIFFSITVLPNTTQFCYEESITGFCAIQNYRNSFINHFTCYEISCKTTWCLCAFVV